MQPTETDLGKAPALRYQLPAVYRIIDDISRHTVPEGHTPSGEIRGGNRDDVKSHCFSFSGIQVARGISHAIDRPVRTMSADHPKPVRHVFMETLDTEEIIDPVALTFLIIPDEVAVAHRDTIHGTMFIGTRQQLREIVMNPQVHITNCSSAQDKTLSMERIWGTKGKLFGFDDLKKADEFYMKSS